MLKWLNAFAFCLWEHENKSWIRDTVKPSSSIPSFFIYTYISVRGNEMHPKAVQVSRLQRQVHPFDLCHFILHPSLKGHNSFCIPSPIASGKHGWPKLGESFSFSHLPWGGPIFDSKQKILLPVFQWHPQFRLPSPYWTYCFFVLFIRWILGTYESDGSSGLPSEHSQNHGNHQLSKIWT